MIRNLLIFSFCLLLFSCTNLDERHVFNYTIEGTAEFVDNIHVVMGPGIDWTSSDKVDLPVDISHDIYGTELEYVFEANHSDASVDITLRIYIDGKLIEEKSEFSSIESTNRISISGIFKDD
tara:strand:+ start:304 stop:669 length:366 start_codon:yes stop_codon:yes gene_type:complete